MRSSLARRLRWLIPVAIVGLVAGVLGAALVNAYRNAPPTDTRSDSRNAQVVDAVTRTEQVALLSLGIQGIAEETRTTTIFGMDVPGSGRALFLQYSFTAKLGLDGEDVRIEQTGEDEFTISIPEFIFIGHDDVGFKLAVENNGVLSWVTPEIDRLEMVNRILDDDAQREHLRSQEGILQDQARSFYTGIIKGIDPTIRVTFDFDSRQ